MSLSNYLSKDILTYVFGLYIDYINVQHILKDIDHDLNFIRSSHINIEEKYNPKTRKLYLKEIFIDDTLIESFCYNKNGDEYCFYSYLNGKNIRSFTKKFYFDGKLKGFSEVNSEYGTNDSYYHNGNKFTEIYKQKMHRKIYSYDGIGNLIQECIIENFNETKYFFDQLIRSKKTLLNKNGRFVREENYDDHGRIIQITDKKRNLLVLYGYVEGTDNYICNIQIKSDCTNNVLYIYEFKECDKCDYHEEYKEHSLLSVISYSNDIIRGTQKFYIIPTIITCWINYENIINNLDKYENIINNSDLKII